MITFIFKLCVILCFSPIYYLYIFPTYSWCHADHFLLIFFLAYRVKVSKQLSGWFLLMINAKLFWLVPGVLETPFFYFTCFDSGYWNVFLTWERWLTQPLLDKKLNTLKLHANVTWMETASLCWATQITMKLIMVFYKATQYDVDCLVLIDITLMIKCMKVSMYVAIWLFFLYARRT